MPYAECRNETCSTGGCCCPACGGRGDLCTCSQVAFNDARRKQLAGLPREPEWSPAHDALWADGNTRLAALMRQPIGDTAWWQPALADALAADARAPDCFDCQFASFGQCSRHGGY